MSFHKHYAVQSKENRYLTSSFFWDFMQHTLFVCLFFVADVSGQPIDLASKRQATMYDP
jgi:hypothetical protein